MTYHRVPVLVALLAVLGGSNLGALQQPLQSRGHARAEASKGNTSALTLVTATASSTVPLQMGGPDTVLGYAPFPTKLNNPPAPEGFYLENKGPYTFKENGDAFSPFFESFSGPIGFNTPKFTGPGDPALPPLPLANPCTDTAGGSGTNGTCAYTSTNPAAYTTPNGDHFSTAFQGYSYIIDDPITNTLTIKLFDPYDESAYNRAAQAFDSANPGVAPLAPSDSNNALLGGDSTLPNATSGLCPLGARIGGVCNTKSIEQAPASNNPFTPSPSTNPTTLEFTLFGPGLSANDSTLPQVVTTTCYTGSNCVYQPVFDAGNDPTACPSTSMCATSPYAYRFFHYAIIHGPGIFRLNVRSVQNANGTYGTGGNAYGIAACNGSTTLGATSDPYTNTAGTPNPGWDPTSCADPNTASGKCANPAVPQPGDQCIHVYGLGKMAIHSWLGAGTSILPLVRVPGQYVGQALQVRLYDIGDIAGGMGSAAMLTPAGDLAHTDGVSSTAGYESALPYTYSASPEDGSGTAAATGYVISGSTSAAANQRISLSGASGTGLYNGSWLNVTVPLTSTGTNGYAGMVAAHGDYWKLLYNIGGPADDGITLEAMITTTVPVPTGTPTITPTTTSPPTQTPTAVATSTSTNTPTQTNTPVPTPSLSVSPTIGVVGQLLTLTGTAFAAHEQVIITWSPGATALISTTSDATGSFTATARIPQATVHGHTLTATGQTSGLTASTAVQVKPTVRVVPAATTPGGRAYLIGAGFAATETVAALWSPGFRLRGTALSNGVGTVVISFTVPITARPSDYVIGYGVTSKSAAAAPGGVTAPPPTSTPAPTATNTPLPTATPTMPPTPTPGVPFHVGDIFVGVDGGTLNHYDAQGHLLAVLTTLPGAAHETGMCFDKDSTLYSTNGVSAPQNVPTPGTMSTFAPSGVPVLTPWPPLPLWSTGTGLAPFGCTADKAGNVYVNLEGTAGANYLDRFTEGGSFTAIYNPRILRIPIPHWYGIVRGDLAADQCTYYYTDYNGANVERFNVCTNTQGATFATGFPAGTCGPLRVRPDFEVLVSCNGNVYRLDAATGVVLQTYTPPANGFYWPLDLDPDGTSFWVGDYVGSAAYKLDIASGAVLAQFTIPLNVNGLAVYGAPSAVNSTPEATPFPPTATPTPLPTETAPPTATATVTATVSLPTSTPPPTATNTTAPTSTPTNTPIPAATATAALTNTAVPPTATATPVDLTTGLVGQWTFDVNGHSGSVIADESGHGNDGTWQVSQGWPTSGGGPFGPDYFGQFDGSRYITSSVNSIPAFNGAMSISLWMRSSSVPSGTSGNATMFALNNSAQARALQLGFRNGMLTAWAFGGSPYLQLSAAATSTLANNAWHNVIYTYDGVGTDNLYIDGVRVPSTIGNMVHQAGVATGLEFGDYAGDSSSSEVYTGDLDGIRIYNVVLSPAQIAALQTQE